jgi:L-fucose isomerase-like protein
MKPIMTNMYHTDVWEGPCRFNVVSPKEEKQRALNAFESFSNELKDNRVGLDRTVVDMMEPELVLFVEDFKINDAEYQKIEDDAREADVLYISPAGSSIATYEIAKKYNKPVVIAWDLNCRTVDIAAYCRTMGLEAYALNSNEERNEIMALLRARKVFSQTRILYPTDRGWPSVASVAGINEPEKLKDQFGIELVTISYKELADEMANTQASESELKDAASMAEIIYKNAEHSYLEKSYVAKSMVFYNTIIRLMRKHECNAFTIECFEFCCSRLPQEWKITPCLVHTMFKDLGIPSACEGDLGGLLSMHMLMSLSKKSAHLGNMFYKDEGTMEINHSVPGIKMNGVDKPALPYQLGRFVESGWGTKAVVDFMNNEEKSVTVARMNPTGTGLLVLKGKLVGSNGWDEDLRGCSVSAFIVGSESGTADEFLRKQVDYGNHLVWVYGDYSEQLKKLGKLVDVNVDVVS